MKWLTNLYDPRLPDAHCMISFRFDSTPMEAWREQSEWLKDKIISRPKATEYYTVEQLEKMNMVGIYACEFELEDIKV